MPDDARNGELVAVHALPLRRARARDRSACRPRPRTLRRDGIVGVDVEEKQHTWGRGAGRQFAGGNAAHDNGELIEFFVVGTAVVPAALERSHRPVPAIVIPANDEVSGGARTSA